ncbi:MAG TPA: hypothetical protein VHU23_14250 [Rhizomicrobium sp.]|jgi:hypothetical protein|nr:hypothetical protein [Rhizomicrobium sp.]
MADDHQRPTVLIFILSGAPFSSWQGRTAPVSAHKLETSLRLRATAVRRLLEEHLFGMPPS